MHASINVSESRFKQLTVKPQPMCFRYLKFLKTEYICINAWFELRSTDKIRHDSWSREGMCVLIFVRMSNGVLSDPLQLKVPTLIGNGVSIRLTTCQIYLESQWLWRLKKTTFRASVGMHAQSYHHWQPEASSIAQIIVESGQLMTAPGVTWEESAKHK